MEAKRILFTEDDVAKLKGRWMEVCPPIVADKYWEVMNQSYREGQRHYHNFFHMRKLYTFFDEHVAPIIKQEIPQDSVKAVTDTFLYSLWFHDIIYDPKRHDNEQQSAEVFGTFAEELQLKDPLRKEVNDIILATISHTLPRHLEQGSLAWTTAALFLDADLSVLAWDAEPYLNDYAWAIWKEYEYYGREKYLEGRTAVLNKLLAKEHLYYHPMIRAQLEAKAKANLASEISLLQKELQALRLVAKTILK